MQLPEGIILLQEKLKPENRVNLMPADEESINADLEECCQRHPGCRHRAECKKLHSTLTDFIPYKRERTSTPRYRTDTQRYADYLPMLSLGAIQQAYTQKQNRYLC